MNQNIQSELKQEKQAEGDSQTGRDTVIQPDNTENKEYEIKKEAGSQSGENKQQEGFFGPTKEDKREEKQENFEEKQIIESKPEQTISEENISKEGEKTEEGLAKTEKLSSPKSEKRRSVSPKKSAEGEEKQDKEERISEPKEPEKKTKGKGERSSSASKAQTKSSEEKPGRKRKSKKEKGREEKEHSRSARKDRKVNQDEYDKYADLLNKKTHRKKSAKP